MWVRTVFTEMNIVAAISAVDSSSARYRRTSSSRELSSCTTSGCRSGSTAALLRARGWVPLDDFAHWEEW